jgi:serine O-acetyltransferase
MQALFWHRISRWLLLNRWTRTARFISLFAIYLTRAELPPTTSIGPAALIPHATGVHLFGRIGARFTMQGEGGCGGGFGTQDIGGGPGYPVVGDDVVLAFGAKVLGPVRVGDGVHVGPCALVTDDLPAGALVMWPKPRVILGGAMPPEARP